MPGFSWDKILKGFGIIVVVLIMVLGIIVATSAYFQGIPKNYRFVFSFFIISYAAFRLVTIFNKSRDDEND
jgi:hypothetical protein